MRARANDIDEPERLTSREIAGAMAGSFGFSPARQARFSDRVSGPQIRRGQKIHLLVAMFGLALGIAGATAQPTGATSRWEAVDAVNSAIDGCFAIGGDPYVYEGAGMAFYCAFDDGYGFEEYWYYES